MGYCIVLRVVSPFCRVLAPLLSLCMHRESENGTWYIGSRILIALCVQYQCVMPVTGVYDPYMQHPSLTFYTGCAIRVTCRVRVPCNNLCESPHKAKQRERERERERGGGREGGREGERERERETKTKFKFPFGSDEWLCDENVCMSYQYRYEYSNRSRHKIYSVYAYTLYSF